jgi:hypothetical protein
MIRNVFLRLAIIIISAFVILPSSKAQPLLPDIQGEIQKGINVVSWITQFDGIKSIAVQRSNDSVFNFAAVGYVKNVKKGPQAFVDGHPNPGVNWYRLYIVFNSDLTWYSNRVKIYVDSAQLLSQPVLPPNDSLQKLVGAITDLSDPSEINAYTYIRSQYVFTNPFTGHINIELPDDRQHAYALKFFDQKNKKIMEVNKLSEPSIILDKRNFQRKGLYKFELIKDGELLETGYITIY